MNEAAPRLELSWIERDLRALDRSPGELVIGTLFEDERPPRGVLGLCDFRLQNRLSSLCLSGFLTGARGERMLVAAKRRRAPFNQMLIVGLGPRAAFDDEVCREAIGVALDGATGLSVRKFAFDLPGRAQGAIAAARALELLDMALFERAGRVDAVVVVDDRDAQRAVEAMRVTPGRRSLAARR